MWNIVCVQEVETLLTKCEKLTEKLEDREQLYQDALRRSKMAEQEAGKHLEAIRQAEEDFCSSQVYQEKLEEERQQVSNPISHFFILFIHLLDYFYPVTV
jgi:hypothetical protein